MCNGDVGSHYMIINHLVQMPFREHDKVILLACICCSIREKPLIILRYISAYFISAMFGISVTASKRISVFVRVATS
jgi:hypothetical protein